jgi:hypothetical protein
MAQFFPFPTAVWSGCVSPNRPVGGGLDLIQAEKLGFDRALSPHQCGPRSAASAAHEHEIIRCYKDLGCPTVSSRPASGHWVGQPVEQAAWSQMPRSRPRRTSTHERAYRAIASPVPTAATIADADPQVTGAVRLAQWVGLGVTATDVGNLRLALMALLPNIAGLVLCFGMALRR